MHLHIQGSMCEELSGVWEAKWCFCQPEDLSQKQEGHVHIITYGSVTHKRVVKNTGKAETYQLIDVVEPTVVCYERASQMRTDTQYGRVLPRVSRRACASPFVAPVATRCRNLVPRPRKNDLASSWHRFDSVCGDQVVAAGQPTYVGRSTLTT